MEREVTLFEKSSEKSRAFRQASSLRSCRHVLVVDALVDTFYFGSAPLRLHVFLEETQLTAKN